MLNAKSIDFLIVGGYAVAFHRAPRFTGDTDILIQPTLEQVNRLLSALQDFVFPASDSKPEDVLEQPRILQLARAKDLAGLEALGLGSP